jgi:PncC family amidohydrolase
MPSTLHTLIRLLRKEGSTVSFAESCSGGKLSSLLTEQSGVSDVFMGSVVSYSNQAKKDLLDVQAESLASEGAVSETVAKQMAQGVRKKMRTDWAVSITGIAGPTGATPQKPVGMVCFGVAGSEFEDSVTRQFEGDRVSIQKQSAEFAMEFLASSLEKSQKNKK